MPETIQEYCLNYLLSKEKYWAKRGVF